MYSWHLVLDFSCCFHLHILGTAQKFWSLYGSSKHYLGYSCEYLHGAVIAHWMLHFSALNGTYSNITFWGVCPHASQLYCHWVMMLRIAALSGILLHPTAVRLYCLCVSLWDLSFLPLQYMQQTLHMSIKSLFIHKRSSLLSSLPIFAWN